MPYGSNPLDPRNPYYQAACLRLESMMEDHQQERVVPRHSDGCCHRTVLTRCSDCPFRPISNSAELHPQEVDPVQHPPHYKAGGMEAIDVIEAFAPGNYHRGNALKYLLRAGRKDVTVQDLRKAIWYIEREISNAIDTARRS